MIVIFKIILIILFLRGTVIILFTDEETETKIGDLTCPSSRPAFNFGRAWDKLTNGDPYTLSHILKAMHFNRNMVLQGVLASGLKLTPHIFPSQLHPILQKAHTHEDTLICTLKLHQNPPQSHPLVSPAALKDQASK